MGVSLPPADRRAFTIGVNSRNTGRDGAADEAVEPVVVGPGRLEGPFADGAAEGLDIDPLLGLGDVAGDELVVGGAAEEGQAAAVAGGGGQRGVHEGLPVVRVE